AQDLRELGREIQLIRGGKQRFRADAGLEDGELRRPRLERFHQRRDRVRVEVGQLGERRGVERLGAAPGDQLAELAAEPALEHRDALAAQGHYREGAMRVLASARRSETLRTSARVSCSCAPRLILSSAVGSNSAITTSVCDSTVAWRASPPAMYAISPKNSLPLTMLSSLPPRVTFASPLARKKKLMPRSFSLTICLPFATRVQRPARASSHSSESASSDSIG